MSSLLQFNGTVDERGVGLLFYLVGKGEPSYSDPVETIARTDDRPPGSFPRHPVLYRAFRKPVGMLGCWVQFRYLGRVNAPDLSLPVAVDTVPRGAVRLTDEEIATYWQS